MHHSFHCSWLYATAPLAHSPTMLEVSRGEGWGGKGRRVLGVMVPHIT